MTKKMKCLSVCYNYTYDYGLFRRTIKGLKQNLSIICKDSIIAISENTSKYDISYSKEDTYRGISLQQIWML